MHQNWKLTVVSALSVFALVWVGWEYANRPAIQLPELVHIAGGSFAFRSAGDYRIGTRVVDAPVTRVDMSALDIMKFQVSERDYARCVADAACQASQSDHLPTLAQTGVNFADATAYALWLSAKTGQHWRLPTDAEWLRAAGSRVADDALASGANGADPSRRWLESYRRDAAVRGEADFTRHPIGYFGENELGLADIAGNVWEWTETCFQSGTLRSDGQAIESISDHCGIRAAQGKHRAFVVDFIRDARSGGCGAGVPPDFLGFRLVRDPAAE